jgi:hypothetical protein
VSSSPSDLRFGSFLLYPQSGTADLCAHGAQAKKILLGVKGHRIWKGPRGDEPVIDLVTARLRQRIPDELLDILGPRVTLVPAPNSARLKPDSLWPPKLIADALCREGLGREVLPCLVRMKGVPKSAYCAPADRPTLADHLASIEVAAQYRLEKPVALCVVDDIISAGVTALACGTLLRAAFPGVTVVAFAMARTQSFSSATMRVDQPCTGVIHPTSSGRARREDVWRAWPVEPP